jgi:predicted dehydrogenase
MERREFLKRAGVLGGAAALPAIPGEGAAAAPVRVGMIVEPGAAHLQYYFESVAAADGVERVAVADASGQLVGQARRQLGTHGPGLATFRDPGEMLRAFEPRVVVVSLAADHAPAAIRVSLEAGAHVLAEKPACVRAQDFAPLVALAESRKLSLMLALATRTQPPAIKARELVQSGALGKIYAVDMHTIADQTRLKAAAYQRSWFASKKQAGGGHLIWLGIHYLDLAEYIMGSRIRQVAGFVANVGGQPIDVEDAAVAALQFEGGAVGTLHSGYYLDRDYHTGIVVWGSEGWVRFDHTAGSAVEWYSTNPGSTQGIQRWAYRADSVAAYPAIVQNAVSAARGLEAPIITGRQCLHVLEVVFGIYRAAETGRAQTV